LCSFGLDACASTVWAADCFCDIIYRDGLAMLARTRDRRTRPARSRQTAVGVRETRAHPLLSLRTGALARDLAQGRKSIEI
jgi:hypothetical protein